MEIPYPGKPFPKFNPSRNNVVTGTSQPRYVPMDVDVARLGGPLTPEERKGLMEENRCFYCRDKGHRAARCWKKPNKQQQTSSPSYPSKETNPFHARAATMEQAPAPLPTNDQEITAHEQITTCLKSLSKDKYNNLLNEMMTEDF